MTEQTQPDSSKVICPACVHQFRAIPCDVQRLLLAAGIEPPFTSQPWPFPVPPQPPRWKVWLARVMGL